MIDDKPCKVDSIRFDLLVHQALEELAVWRSDTEEECPADHFVDGLSQTAIFFIMIINGSPQSSRPAP